MTRKIIIHNSEKIICKYSGNGYCRFQEVCKFMHPKENCENQNVKIKNVLKDIQNSVSILDEKSVNLMKNVCLDMGIIVKNLPLIEKVP